VLYPDSTIFLGDLFDGGREWATAHSKSPESRYQKYGDKFWQKEYRRFSKIFFDTWIKAGVAGRIGQPSRRSLLTNLPGNHDLGFASGIQEPVRNRFNAYFGDGNAINFIGNHTIVSLDTVSLSAKDDPAAPQHLWLPAQGFLDDYNSILDRSQTSYLRIHEGRHSWTPYVHDAVDGEALQHSYLPEPAASRPSYPTILLTHVPLYRDTGTPCGPLREKYPQSRDSAGKLVNFDERNAISVSSGYQYQNVLSPEISKEITTKIGNLSFAFSGDDHDYCDVVHRRYPSAGGGIREITVKSISWAMGIRRPGFQMVSLWNPIGTSGVTLQTHMCLLPDQLAIFIRYAFFFAATAIILLGRAGYLMLNPSLSSYSGNTRPILPLSVGTASSSEVEKAESSSSDDGNSGLLIARPRQWQKSDGSSSLNPSSKPSVGYGLPTYHSKVDGKPARHAFAQSLPSLTTIVRITARWRGGGHIRLKGIGLLKAEFLNATGSVAMVVLPFYWWLVWSG